MLSIEAGLRVVFGLKKIKLMNVSMLDCFLCVCHFVCSAGNGLGIVSSFTIKSVYDNIRFAQSLVVGS
jgi:hypothetical protein